MPSTLNFGNVPIPVLILCKDLFLFVSVFLSVHVCSCPQRVVVPWRWSSELWSSLRAANAINPRAASLALSGCVYVRINKRCCLASKSCISNRKSRGMERSCLHPRYATRLKFSKLYLHPGHIMNDFWWGFQLSQEVKLEVCQASNPVRTYPRWGCSQWSAGPSAFYLRLCSYKQALCVLLLNGRQSLFLLFGPLLTD